MNIKDNKVLKILLMVVKLVMTLVVVGVFLIIFLQRVSSNKVTLGGFSIYTVISESMLPKYELWDMILTEEVDIEDIKVGDDIVYMGEKDDFKDKIVTHRVIDVKKEGDKYIFKTKGINNDIEDPEITGNQILGKVIYKSVILSFLSGIVNNIYGFYFLVFIPLVIIIFLEILEAINERKALSRQEEE